jgi:hypothetical protein
MAETGWPLIPREVLPASIPPAAKATRRPPVTPADAGRQLSIFGAETTEPSPSDLAALLAGPGRLDKMGGTARVSVRVDAAWRVHVLVAELVSRGLVVNWRRLDQDPNSAVRHTESPEFREVPPHAAEIPVNPDSDPAAPPDGPIPDARDPAAPGQSVASPEPRRDELGPKKLGLQKRGAKKPSRPEPPPDEPGPDELSQVEPDLDELSQVEPEPDERSSDGVIHDESSTGEPEITPESGITPAPGVTEAPDAGPDGEEHDPGATGIAPAMFEVRTAYSSRLKALALAWPTAADQLFLSGPRLRLWVAATGRPMDGGYALGLDPGYAPGTTEEAGAALRRAGLEAVLSDHGRDYLIMGRRRLARLAELVGERPAAAPEAFWPGGPAA